MSLNLKGRNGGPDTQLAHEKKLTQGEVFKPRWRKQGKRLEKKEKEARENALQFL